MLARYMLSSCVHVCLLVSHKPVIVSKQLDESSWVFLAWIGLSFTYSRMLFKAIWVSRKYYVTSLWDLVPNSGLRKFRHSKSIALSTKLVVVVDGRACWRHLYDSRRVVAVYNGSVSCNPLTPLLWFLCGFVVQLVCTVDKILSRGPSAEAWELLVLT